MCKDGTEGGAAEAIAPPLFCIVRIAPPSFAQSESARFSVSTRACLALSRTFQKKDLSAIAAKKGSLVVVSTLKELRNDSELSKFWTNVRERAIQLEVYRRDPILPRRRKLPKRLDESNSTTFHDATPEDMYKRYYFELIDTVMGE